MCGAARAGRMCRDHCNRFIIDALDRSRGVQSAHATD